MVLILDLLLLPKVPWLSFGMSLCISFSGFSSITEAPEELLLSEVVKEGWVAYVLLLESDWRLEARAADRVGFWDERDRGETEAGICEGIDGEERERGDPGAVGTARCWDEDLRPSFGSLSNDVCFSEAGILSCKGVLGVGMIWVTGTIVTLERVYIFRKLYFSPLAFFPTCSRKSSKRKNEEGLNSLRSCCEVKKQKRQ